MKTTIPTSALVETVRQLSILWKLMWKWPCHYPKVLFYFFLFTWLPAFYLASAFGAAPVVPNKSRIINDIQTASASATSPNNLLSGVTDPDGGTGFTITSFAVGGVVTPVPGTYIILNTDPQFLGTNIGTITINANGTYTFTPAQLVSPGAISYNRHYGPVPLITFTVADTQNEITEASLQITVNPFNQGPTNLIPSYNTPEDTPLTLNTVVNGTPSLSETDDARELDAPITVSLFVAYDANAAFTGSMGTMSAGPGHGLTVTVRNDSDGMADGKADTVGVILTGPISGVNAYLADPVGNPIVWTPPADYHTATGCLNSYQLTMLGNDLGNTANGAPTAPRIDRTTRRIGILSRPDITNDALTTTFNTPKHFNVLTGTNGATVDNFEGSNPQVTAVNGAAVSNGQTIVLPSGNNITVSSNGDMIFTPVNGFTGADNFQYSALSGFCPETATVTVDVGSMPVTLISFTAKVLENVVRLEWSTSEEINSAYFEIQHSNDAIVWNAVSQIPAMKSSRTVANYLHEDKAPKRGLSYYRLKMVDIDSSYTYSAIRTAELSRRAPTQTVYPNPANAVVNLPGVSDGTIKMYHADGRTFMMYVLNQQMDIRDIPKGTYILRLEAPGKESSTRKLLVVK